MFVHNFVCIIQTIFDVKSFLQYDFENHFSLFYTIVLLVLVINLCFLEYFYN